LNDYILSVLLGIVEGLTEFLPVSSTAHLRLTEALLHVDLTSPYWKMYTVVIQLGAILALVVLFTSRIMEFFRTFPEGERAASSMTRRNGHLPRFWGNQHHDSIEEIYHATSSSSHLNRSPGCGLSV